MESAPPQPGQPERTGPDHGQDRPAQPDHGQDRAGQQLAVAGACYAMLLLLGVAEGVVGAFQYSGGIGPFPGAALGFDALILVTCVLAAWGMRRPAAGLMPAVGWFAASFVLAMRTPGGSIVITDTAAGKWFLFGGAACAAAGVVASLSGWSAPRAPRRGQLSRPVQLSRPGELRPRKPGS